MAAPSSKQLVLVLGVLAIVALAFWPAVPFAMVAVGLVLLQTDRRAAELLLVVGTLLIIALVAFLVLPDGSDVLEVVP